MYKVQDLQGGGLMRSRSWKTLNALRDDLADFHSIDVEGTESMTLADLCEIGSWGVIDENDNEVLV